MGDEASAERVAIELGESSGVVASAFGAASDALVGRCSGQWSVAEFAVLGDGQQQRCPGHGTRHSPTTHVSVERFSHAQQADHESSAAIERGDDLVPTGMGPWRTPSMGSVCGNALTDPLPSWSVFDLLIRM